MRGRVFRKSRLKWQRALMRRAPKYARRKEHGYNLRAASRLLGPEGKRGMLTRRLPDGSIKLWTPSRQVALDQHELGVRAARYLQRPRPRSSVLAWEHEDAIVGLGNYATGRDRLGFVEFLEEGS